MNQWSDPSVLAAWYAAAVATLVAIAQIADIIRRRPRVEVSGTKVTVITSGKKKSFMRISVHNSGRRPVSIVSAGVVFKDKSTMSSSTAKDGAECPLYLNDNSAVVFELPYDTLAVHEKKRGISISKVFCETVKGKQYTGKCI